MQSTKTMPAVRRKRQWMPFAPSKSRRREFFKHGRPLIVKRLSHRWQDRPIKTRQFSKLPNPNTLELAMHSSVEPTALESIG